MSEIFSRVFRTPRDLLEGEIKRVKADLSTAKEYRRTCDSTIANLERRLNDLEEALSAIALVADKTGGEAQ